MRRQADKPGLAVQRVDRPTAAAGKVTDGVAGLQMDARDDLDLARRELRVKLRRVRQRRQQVGSTRAEGILAVDQQQLFLEPERERLRTIESLEQ